MLFTFLFSQKLPNHSEKILIKKNTFSIDFDWRSNESGFYYQHYDLAKSFKLNNNWSTAFNFRLIGRVEDGNLIWNERRPHVSLQKRLNKKNIRWTLRTRQELRLRDDKDPVTRNRFRIFAKSNKLLGKFRPYLGNEFFFDFEKKSYNKNWLVFGFDLTESSQYAPTIYYKLISDLVDGKWTSTYTLIFKVTI